MVASDSHHRPVASSLEGAGSYHDSRTRGEGGDTDGGESASASGSVGEGGVTPGRATRQAAAHTPAGDGDAAGAALDGRLECLSAAALADRLDEEINRAGRHGTQLSCLLIAIDDVAEMASQHGRELSEQALSYAGPVLIRELRRFDRVGRPSDTELLVLLPGADGPRGEIVARRVIDRLRAIKIESGGVRRPLRVSVGLAAWRQDLSGEQLLAQTRAAAQRERDELVTGRQPAPRTG